MEALELLKSNVTMAYFSEVAPWVAVIEILFVGFFATMVIRHNFEKKLYFLPYSGFWLGMTAGLGLIAYAVSEGTQGYQATSRWHDQAWFMLILAAIGLYVALRNSCNTEKRTGRSIWMPSELWLWLVAAPILTPCLVRGLIVLRQYAGADSGEFALATAGIFIYISTLLFDAWRFKPPESNS